MIKTYDLVRVSRWFDYEQRMVESTYYTGLPDGQGDYVKMSDLVAEVREWAAYCRSCQPGPNIADTMLKFIGDPPHDYQSDRETQP